jgi:hypothetical protein
MKGAVIGIETGGGNAETGLRPKGTARSHSSMGLMLKPQQSDTPSRGPSSLKLLPSAGKTSKRRFAS